MVATPNDRPRGILVNQFSELRKYAASFAAGRFHLLIVVGAPGVGKSQAFRRAVGDDGVWIEGATSAFGMYRLLSEHRDRLVVLDDVDAILKDRESVRLLKAVCQTDPVKRLAWNTASSGDGRGTPSQFETSSRVVIIANEICRLSPDARAVIDRGISVRFEPTPMEVHQEVGNWFWNQAVYDWFADNLPLFDRPSMRYYLHASELYDAGMDWRSYLLNFAVDERLMPAAQVLSNPDFQSESERVAAFRELGGGSRSTFYNHQKRLRGIRDGAAPRRTLANAR